jgi:hypothetical protein
MRAPSDKASVVPVADSGGFQPPAVRPDKRAVDAYIAAWKVHFIGPGEDLHLAGQTSLAVDARLYRWVFTDVTGRPSSKDPIVEEARRRLEKGEVPSDLKKKKEFEYQVYEWFVEQRKLNPKLPEMSFGRVQKAMRADKDISELWRAHRARH